MSKVCCTKDKCSVFLSLRFQVTYDVQYFFAIHFCNLKGVKRHFILSAFTEAMHVYYINGNGLTHT